MGVLLGVLSSLLYGLGDFAGGEAARRAPASSVVLWAGLASFPVILAAALMIGGSASHADLLYGLAAGSAGALGLVLLFAGLARGNAAAVAPAAAAVMAVFPLTIAVALGERPSVMAWSGVALAIPAIVLCSWTASRGDAPVGGLSYGVVAGVMFGVYVVLISQTREASNLLPLIPARLATMGVVAAVALAGVWKVQRFSRMPKGWVIGNGLLDVAGNVAFIIGLRIGPLSLVSVAAATSPAVTVALASIINREKLRKRQILGLVLILVALALITLG